ncbi:COMMD7 (predicted) [Pycnogonum litorale]
MTGFHFTDGQPQESVFTDFQTLNRFTLDQFSRVVDIIFRFLSDLSKTEWLFQQLEQFSQSHSVNLVGLKSVVRSLISVSNGAVKKNLNAAQVKKDLVSLGLSDDKAESFSSKWNEKLSVMSKAALSQTLTVNQLVDIDWKFGVTAASSELNKVGNTFLQLKLIINKGGTENENVFMELSLPQFYSFLHEMEKAKASLEYLS